MFFLNCKFVSSSGNASNQHDDVVLAQLMTLGFAREACRLALRRCENDGDAAAAWLLDDANLPEIMAQSMFADAAPTTTTTTTARMTKRKRDGSDAQASGDDDDAADQDADNAAPSSAMRRTSSVTRLALLEAEGLSGPAAEYALHLFGGDASLARVWLLDGTNRAQIDAIIAADADAVKAYNKLAESGAGEAALDASS